MLPLQGHETMRNRVRFSLGDCIMLCKTNDAERGWWSQGQSLADPKAEGRTQKTFQLKRWEGNMLEKTKRLWLPALLGMGRPRQRR